MTDVDDDDELARLALLSNTAILKNQIGKESPTEEAGPSRKVSVKLPRRRGVQRNDSTSPQSIMDSSPPPPPPPPHPLPLPQAQDPAAYAMISSHPYRFQYIPQTTTESSSSSSPSYSTFPSSYHSQTRQDDRLYFLEHLTSPVSPETPVDVARRQAYNAKENFQPTSSHFVANQHHPIFHTFTNTRQEQQQQQQHHHHHHQQQQKHQYHHHQQQQQQQHQHLDDSPSRSPPSYESLRRENLHLREQLKDKDYRIFSLEQQLYNLENQITELRQLPTGKISHIPIE